MSNNALYTFLTKKCKDRKLPIEAMPKRFGFSRSSLYRYMKGLVQMSPEVQERFVRELQMDEKEQQEFCNAVELAQFDADTIAVRAALDAFIFGKEPTEAPLSATTLVYIENDKFLRTFQEFFDIVQALAAQPDHQCQIRMINGVGLDSTRAAITFLKKVLHGIQNASVEHLINFSEKDRRFNINTLISVLPLLQHTNYSLLCSKNYNPCGEKTWFCDALIIEIHKNESLVRQFFVTLHEKTLSTCLVTAEPHAASFFNLNYDAMRTEYNASFLDASGIDTFSSAMAELEENAHFYLLKPNCCYHRIPGDVYRSMMTRITPEQCAEAQEGLQDYGGSLASGLALLERRAAASYVRTQIDVHSQEGLTEFARTGRLSDHFHFFPSLNAQERRSVLEYMRDRNADPDDPYTLYITRQPFFDNGYILVGLENTGLMLEYSHADYTKGLCSNLFIRNTMFADMLSDYVRQHIPRQHSLNKEECTDFMNVLLAQVEHSEEVRP